MRAAGLTIVRWHRYEIENYLLVPDAIGRMLSPDRGDMFSHAEADAALTYLKHSCQNLKALCEMAIVEVERPRHHRRNLYEVDGVGREPGGSENLGAGR